MTNRPIFRAILAAVALLVLSAGVWGFRRWRQIDELESENERLEAQVRWERASSRAKDRHVALITQVLNEVGDRIENMQKERFELSIFAVSADIEGRQLLREESLLERLEAIRENARLNEEQIDQLEHLLAAGNGRLAALESMAFRLRERNQELELEAERLQAEIVELNRRVEELETTVVDLETEVEDQQIVIADQQDTIEEQTAELAQQEEELAEQQRRERRVYFTAGTRDALIAQTILREDKGFWRKKRYLNSNPELVAKYFQEIDRGSVSELFLGEGLRKIELLPPRPPNSYTFRRQDGVLEVVDPEQFWQSPYLVVITFPKRSFW